MRIFLTTAVLVASTFLLTSSFAQAQVDEPQTDETEIQETETDVNVRIGPRVTGDVGDIGETAIGATARLEVDEFPIQASGAFDLYLSEGNGTIFTTDLNAQVPVELEDRWFLPYVGAGLGLTRVSGDGGTTDLGVNLLGGAEVNLRFFRPFAQAQVTLGDDFDRVGLTGGVLFNI